MTPLNFPPGPPFEIRDEGGRAFILDVIRRRFVRLTPEEWVRQHLLRYLTRDLGYPAGLLAVEKQLAAAGGPRRADVVAYGRGPGGSRPVLIAECKAPSVAVTQAVFDQVSRYNAVALAPHLVVTNGLLHYCWVVDREARRYRFLEAIPPYVRLAP